MSRVGSVSINLDDVFGALPTLTTTTNVKASPVPSEYHSSRKSSVSTIKEKPAPRSVVSSHITTTTVSRTVTAPPPQPPQDHHYTNIPASNDPLLDSIFSAVSLPVVQNHTHHDDVIRQIDDVLQDFDQESIADEPSYRAPSTHVSSHISSHHQYVSAAHPQNTGSVVSNGTAKHYNAYENTPNPDYDDERSDAFDSNHQYPQKQNHASIIRDRSNTIDSSASYAESRFGQFDVHDDNDRYTAEQINLNHNEVAYRRVEPVSLPGSVISGHSHRSFHTGGTQKLRNIQREVDDARNKRAQLSHQVDRQRYDNDRLKQSNLAREASLRVNQGTKPGAYVIKSYNDLPRPVSQHSSHSNESWSIYEEEEVKVSKLAARQKASGTLLSNSGKYELYVPQYYIVDNFSRNERINKVVIGGEAEPTDEDKTLLLFGPVSSGKTSVVTSMMNYLYDVKKENEFRFVIDEHITPTTGLTAYVFNNTILPFNVTIVDTPGIVNQHGNKTVSKLIKEWFEKELIEEGAFRLDAISIVLRHDQNTLDWPFIYELADVKRMFGDDLKTNVLPIITNADVLPQPLAIKSLTQANIAFLEYYKVNNAGFASDTHGVSKLQHNLYWTHGVASLENLFNDLQEQIHPLVAILRHKKGKPVEPSKTLANKTLY
ncbi:unnamed protein product [Caenorhabditis angaria]|uniref:G domain-containing protein n=1 Tax=Caenorhabditis angaria TaxID=860376 RepID=A0A9P1NC38_9PELO|nr:unnamed protein product [Caenorhabditis angaria]